MSKERGTLFVLSGPSGTGKGTVLNKFFEIYGKDDVFLSISATTREPRVGEKDGENYYFKRKDEFEEMIRNGELLEWALFCDNYYGTPIKKVYEKLESGIDVVLEIEVQGAIKIMESEHKAEFIFIAPPSMEELKNRIVNRKTESEESINKRLETAIWEISNVKKYKYTIVNDEVEKAARKLQSIIEAERCLTSKNNNIINEVCKI